MINESTQKKKNSWWSLFRFFIVWFICNMITYIFIVLPFNIDSINQSLEEFDRKHASDDWFSILINLSVLLGSLLAFWYVKEKIEKTSVKEFYRPSLVSIARGSNIGLFIVLACTIVLSVFNLISFSFLSVATLPKLILVYAMVAVSEEVVFRGYVLNNLRESLPRSFAIVLSASLFSVMHMGNSYFGVIGFTNIFLGGILMAIVYLQSDNLAVPVGLHFSWNLTQAVLGFAVSGHESAGMLSILYNSPNWLLTGGKFGIEGSIVLTPLLLISIVLVTRRNYFKTEK